MYPDRNTKTIALKWSWKLVSMVKWGVRELLKRQTLQTLEASAAFKSCGFSGYFITYFPFHPAVVIRRNFIGNSDHGFTCQAPATVSHDKYSALCVDSIEGNTAIYTAKHVESGFDLHQDHEKKLLFQLKTMKKCNTYQDFDRMPLHISHQLKHWIFPGQTLPTLMKYGTYNRVTSWACGIIRYEISSFRYKCWFSNESSMTKMKG